MPVPDLLSQNLWYGGLGAQGPWILIGIPVDSWKCWIFENCFSNDRKLIIRMTHSQWCENQLESLCKCRFSELPSDCKTQWVCGGGQGSAFWPSILSVPLPHPSIHCCRCLSLKLRETGTSFSSFSWFDHCYSHVDFVFLHLTEKWWIFTRLSVWISPTPDCDHGESISKHMILLAVVRGEGSVKCLKLTPEWPMLPLSSIKHQ